MRVVTMLSPGRSSRPRASQFIPSAAESMNPIRSAGTFHRSAILFRQAETRSNIWRRPFAPALLQVENCW